MERASEISSVISAVSQTGARIAVFISMGADVSMYISINVMLLEYDFINEERKVMNK